MDARSSWPDKNSDNIDANNGVAVLDYDENADEEGVDALGTVVFADEVESGFYGEFTPFLPISRRHGIQTPRQVHHQTSHCSVKSLWLRLAPARSCLSPRQGLWNREIGSVAVWSPSRSLALLSVQNLRH